VSEILPSSDLPPARIFLRPAKREDEAAIRALVKAEHLNPFNIHWQNFLVAEDAARRMVGIGQVKTHRDGSRELASIATSAEWRKRGVASAIIRALLAHESSAPASPRARPREAGETGAGDLSSAQASPRGAGAGEYRGPLYLMCRDTLTPFYERFGFREIGLGEMTPHFRRVFRVMQVLIAIFQRGDRVAVMRR
jgi:GNAT superfamily N-acetyltransferase